MFCVSALDLAAVTRCDVVLSFCKMAQRDTFSEFNPSVEDFDCYIERLGMYFEANDIIDNKKKSVFLSVVGAKYYKLLRSLCSPGAPASKTFEELVDTLKAHVSPKPLVIGERFKFHNVSVRT